MHDLFIPLAHINNVAASDIAANVSGRASVVFTTWGFSLFAVLAVAAIAQTPGSGRTKTAVRLLIGGAASLVGAGVGLAIKTSVAERRPCQVDPAVAPWSTCPAAGDWSFPSNHSVFAGALAVTAISASRLVGRRWIAVVALVLAVGIAASRVALGVHYWWDVVAGLALGASVATLAIEVVAVRIERRVDRHRRRGLPAGA